MNIYFSGLAGTGIGPLAELAHDAGHRIFGSDQSTGAIVSELSEKGIQPHIGSQNGNYLREIYDAYGIDWFVHTSALPAGHPELVLAKQLRIRCSKRDDFLSKFITEHKLQLIAVAGTHGKTTTTSMLIWSFQQLNIPISYIVGTTLSFADCGHFDPESKYLVYEADEYDRNFLKFHPDIALIPSVSYDHPDIYPSKKDYIDAFKQFISQCHKVYMWPNDDAELTSQDHVHLLTDIHSELSLAGVANRANATLAAAVIFDTFNPYSEKDAIDIDTHTINALNLFPGSSRRFEQLIDGLYTDYAHHPDEIKATLQMASELSDKITVVYQPHQNTRQHEVKDGYRTAFEKAENIFWLPTYLTRENSDLPTLSQSDLISELENPSIATPADLNDQLLADIKTTLDNGYLVILMAAGPADGWLREHLDYFKS